MFRPLILAAVLLAGAALAIDARAASLPEWVRSAASGPVQIFGREVSYVVLLDEQYRIVHDNGKADTRFRYVVRILTREGRVAGRREIYYDGDTKLIGLRAWHIRPDEQVVPLGKDEITEESPAGDLYNNGGVKVMKFADVDAGSIVAFEWEQRERPLVNQTYHYFQNRAPVAVARLRLSLPQGWGIKTYVFNYGSIPASVEEDSYIWEVHDLPPISEEPFMPDVNTIAPRIAVSYFPDNESLARNSFKSWVGVSRWAWEVDENQAICTPEIASRAREITDGLPTEYEKIRAVSRWVQKRIRYVSIQLGAIGGYRPHTAESVMQKGYGDCKDKVCLMQSMLSGIGVTSYAVLAYAGDPMRVKSRFPSPLQFNHAIIAIKVTADCPGAVNHPRQGRILFFDPTDSFTPIGDLPSSLHNGFALIVRPFGGELVQLPGFTERTNTARREVTIRLQPDGGLVASIREVYAGQPAAFARQAIPQDVAEYAKMVETRITHSVPRAAVSGVKVNLAADLGEPLVVEYTVEAPGYANLAGNLMVLKPVAFWDSGYPVFQETERQHPIVFSMRYSMEETISLSVPEGFVIDELSPAVDLRTGPGIFSLSSKSEGRSLSLEKRLVVNRQILPVSEYGDVKRFFDTAQKAAQSGIVFLRK